MCHQCIVETLSAVTTFACLSRNAQNWSDITLRCIAKKAHTFAVSATQYWCLYASLRLVCVQRRCEFESLQLPCWLPPSTVLCCHASKLQTPVPQRRANILHACRPFHSYKHAWLREPDLSRISRHGTRSNAAYKFLDDIFSEALPR